MALVVFQSQPPSKCTAGLSGSITHPLAHRHHGKRRRFSLQSILTIYSESACSETPTGAHPPTTYLNSLLARLLRPRILRLRNSPGLSDTRLSIRILRTPYCRILRTPRSFLNIPTQKARATARQANAVSNGKLELL